ncbi:MAG TPA: UpxY family transcription antiterminator [Rubricoccaceae bacterium]|jgi:transcription antitermination factor NusG
MTPATAVWRVFYTKPRAEKRVAERLAASGLDVFLPLRTTLRQWSDRQQRVEVPLFPGYLFACVDERARLGALEDEGVVKTVHFGGVLAVVPDREMALIRALAASPERVEAVGRDAFPLGAEVYVLRGPLAGVHGRVVGHPRDLYLLVEVPSVQQAVRIHLPADWAVRPASEAPAHASVYAVARPFIRPDMR